MLLDTKNVIKGFQVIGEKMTEMLWENIKKYTQRDNCKI